MFDVILSNGETGSPIYDDLFFFQKLSTQDMKSVNDIGQKDKNIWGKDCPPQNLSLRGKMSVVSATLLEKCYLELEDALHRIELEHKVQNGMSVFQL